MKTRVICLVLVLLIGYSLLFACNNRYQLLVSLLFWTGYCSLQAKIIYDDEMDKLK